MKNKYLATLALVGLLGGVGYLTSCSSDETFKKPEISLSTTEVTAAPGEEVTVTVTVDTDAAFVSLLVTKLWDGTAVATQTFDELPADSFNFTYLVTDEDADHILTLNFLLTDKEGKTVAVDLVITVELTARQLLLKYNWRLSDEIRKKNNSSDINDVYNDDVYRFNADGTYDKSIGAKADDFNDGWYNYCYWDLNDNTLRLLMSRTGAFGEIPTDTLNITTITNALLHADVTYYGLDQLDDTYDPAEDYNKQFVSVAKVSTFDKYKAGTTDDAGPAGACTAVTFDN